MISEMIREDFCLVNTKADDWEGAVRKAGEILVRNACVEPGYVDEMVRVVKEAGPYIVIAKGIALAHARPDCGVKKIGLSVITLEEPIPFGNPDNDPVKLVLGLAAVDNNSHLDVIRDMVQFLSDESLEVIYACKTEKELSDYLKTF